MSVAPPQAPPARGLTSAEAGRLLAAGVANHRPEQRSRSYRDIVVANVFNRFNAMLGLLLVVTLWVGPIQDAAFGLVLVANLAIGLVQEIRAKRMLDRVEVLVAPGARVLRDGREQQVAPGAVVHGDVVVLSRGDQLVADGTVLEADGLEVDESLLTGESEPVGKEAGSAVRSGTFVVAGGGTYEATATGAASYAARLAEHARQFKRTRSELRRDTNRILRVIGWLMPVAAVMLLVSQFDAHSSTIDAIRAAVAGMVTLVPEGLVLLTSLAFATAVLRLASRGALAQELPAVETVARTDVVCMDKTGTLTEGRITLSEVRSLDPGLDVGAALGALAASAPAHNAVLAAIAGAAPPPAGWRALATVGFSSARRWSAAAFEGRGTWVLGAPEAIAGRDRGGEWRQALLAAADAAQAGSRVVALAHTPGDALVADSLPAGLRPAALVLFDERLRPEAAGMIAYFQRQGVELRLLTGDSELTARAVARRLGLDESAVTGRASPEAKRRIIADLQAAGHVVAMAGDGVNDVPALKQADVAISLASGAPATRAISQFVLLRSDFDSVPEIVAEGRRVIGNMERLGRLFVTKTAYAFLISIVVGLLGLPFPFLLRQLTFVSMFTIGLPSFFLALEPSLSRAEPGFGRRTLRFAVPAGATIGAVTLACFAASSWSGAVSLHEARTIATLVLGGLSFWLLVIVSRPLTSARRVVVGLAAGAALAALGVPAVREFFAVAPLPAWCWIAVPGAIAAGGLLLEVAARAGTRRGGRAAAQAS